MTNRIDSPLGVILTDAGLDPEPPISDLVGLAVRRNPRRAHLLVSQVLGKHVPADPGVVLAAAGRLAGAVEDELTGASATVLGFAETATALGHCVAHDLGAPYIHSTRRAVPSLSPYAGFDETHSHAPSHLLLPEDPAFLERDDVLVLVDDELSTGATALATIAALHGRHPRARYVIAALVDLRDPDDIRRLEQQARDLGTSIVAVALARGAVTVPHDLRARFEAWARDVAPHSLPAPPFGEVRRLAAPWDAGVPEGGRHGTLGPDPAFDSAVRRTARAIAAVLPSEGTVHVLGTEELMFAPLQIAAALTDSHEVTFSSTTRSPVYALDDASYAVRTSVTFGAHDGVDVELPRYVYNLRPGAYDAIVLVVDGVADTAALGSLVDQLVMLTSLVLVVTVPCHIPGLDVPATPLAGPEFGSYPTADVTWLLKDLSTVPLERPVAEREPAIQSGAAHYAESLPVEYEPDAEYLALFEDALRSSARRVAHAVGMVTEQVLAHRGRLVVLASLARAGTPIGVLMRRWAGEMHDLDLSHYAVSIVRGRGIDEVALRHLAQRHDPASVVFIDGWTGKGAIANELAESLRVANEHLGTAFSPELAALADPGECIAVWGTRDDFLIPSACLNSTVSGLVSRTVLNDRWIGPQQFHGAKFYAELRARDRSNAFVDTVAGLFAEVRDDVLDDVPACGAPGRGPTWRGWRDAERIAATYGIADVNLVKPGVGETTRVLLRRTPWQILVDPARSVELTHVLHLAAQRGVPVVEEPGLTYSCVGLIQPLRSDA